MWCSWKARLTFPNPLHNNLYRMQLGGSVRWQPFASYRTENESASPLPHERKSSRVIQLSIPGVKTHLIRERLRYPELVVDDQTDFGETREFAGSERPP